MLLHYDRRTWLKVTSFTPVDGVVLLFRGSIHGGNFFFWSSLRFLGVQECLLNGMFRGLGAF